MTKKKTKLKAVKGDPPEGNKASRNPVTRSPIQPPLHPPKPEPEPKNVRHLTIVTGDDPDDAA